MDALHRQIKELEIQELELSLTLHRSQLEACKTMAKTPSDLGTLHSLPIDQLYGLTSVDTPKSIGQIVILQLDRKKNLTSSLTVEWKDFIVHFVYPRISGHFMNRDNS